MKVHTCLFFMLVFTACWIYQAALIVHFYANQESIAAAHCVNLDKPEMKCHGKCHLQKELGISKNEQDSPARTINLKFWMFGLELIDELQLKTFKDEVRADVYRGDLLPAIFLEGVFIPPAGIV